MSERDIHTGIQRFNNDENSALHFMDGFASEETRADLQEGFNRAKTEALLEETRRNARNDDDD